jgi:hypothetical protein
MPLYKNNDTKPPTTADAPVTIMTLAERPLAALLVPEELPEPELVP